jgi:hypothetical protein
MGTLKTSAVCTVACMTLLAGPALAAEQAAAKTNQIRIAYVAPKNPAHQPLHDALKQRQVLEKLQAFFSPLRLPRPLLIKVAGCDGVSNAWYEDDAVTLCYEYLDDIFKAARSEKRPPEVSERAALIGPFCDVVFHEMAHALFDYLQIPVFGREEDAADNVSAYVMLQFGRDEARELLAGAVYSYAIEIKLAGTGRSAEPAGPSDPKQRMHKAEVTQKLEKFADEHSTPAQRFYNYFCIAYGADPKYFAGIVEKGWLPKARAEGCEYDYEQIAFAYRTLIGPHVDPKLAKKVRSQKWLPPVKARPAYRPEAAPPQG